MYKVFSNSILLSLVMVFAVSCNNSSTTTNVDSKDTVLADAGRIDSLTAEKKKHIEFKFLMMEANLPSPFEIVNDLYAYQVPFKEELLNPADKAGSYVTAFKKSVNYGVYGIDLGYINFYGQNQQLLNYYSATKKLAEELKIEQAFNSFADRLSANSSNKDSVIALIDHAFSETDAYLKKNERFVASSHVIAGALVEVNYLSLNLLKDVPQTPENKRVYDKVYNENVYIYHLINLLKEYTDKDSQALLKSLEAYRKSYDEIIKSPEDLGAKNIDKVISLITVVRKMIVS